MKTIYLQKPGKLSIQNIPLRKLKESEILIKISSALTCGTTLKSFLRGHSKIKMPGPFGHEFAGIVEAIGKNVTRFKVNDRIVCLHTGFCGTCFYCNQGKTNLCKYFDKFINLGAYSEKIIIPKHIVENFSFKIPKNISFTRASFLQSLSCIIHGIDLIKPKKADRILIIGTGSFGILFAIVFKALNFNYIMLGRNKFKCRELNKNGFNAESNIKQIKKTFNDKSANIVIEAVGKTETWEKAIDLSDNGGKVLFFGGLPKNSFPNLDPHKIHYSELKLYGTFNYLKKDVIKAKQLLFNKIDPTFLVSGQFPLLKLKDAFINMKEGNGYKYEIIP